MRINKKLITLIIGGSVLFTGCSSKPKNDIDPVINDTNLEQDQGGTTEEFVEEDLSTPQLVTLKDYNDVVNFYTQYGSGLEKLFTKHEINYYTSTNKSFGSTEKESYTAFDNEYFYSAKHEMPIKYVSGEGNFYFTMQKEFHSEKELTLEDNYVAAMYDLFKTYDKTVTEESFLQMINDNTTLDENGNPATVNEQRNHFNILRTQDGYRKKLSASIYVPVQMANAGETYREYAKFDEFKGMTETFGPSSIHNNMPLSDAKTEPLYTIEYNNTTQGDFSESTIITMTENLTGFEYDSDSYGIGITAKDMGTFKVTEDMQTNIKLFMEKVELVLGVKIADYMTEEQFFNEVETSLLKSAIGFEDSGWEVGLPIPGILLETSIYTEDEYATDPELKYMIRLDSYRPVKAEGITGA